MIKAIDLNCDLGEGYDDAAIMPFISSCNIACGGHYGDANTMRTAINLATKNAVAVGAHPGYPDKENFGRVSLSMGWDELSISIEKQLKQFVEICDDLGVRLHHIKPHGALYNDMVRDKDLAEQVLELLKSLFPETIIYGMANSHLIQMTKLLNLNFWEEAFIDRNYSDASTLLGRSQENAVLKDVKRIYSRIDNLMNKRLVDFKGISHFIRPRTLCLHSDTDDAALIAKEVYKHLELNGVNITSDS